MARNYLTPENTAIIMIDHAVGFANTFRSADLRHHVSTVVGLAKTAQIFDIPLIVTNGPDTMPPGPLYPQLMEVIGDHPVIIRNSAPFDAFEEPAFREAVEATGRRRLLIAGLDTEGCVIQTALTANAEGYEVFVVVDASAGQTTESHGTAVMRMVQAGIVPATWMSLTAEFQRSWQNLETAAEFGALFNDHHITFSMLRTLVEHFSSRSE